MTVNTTTITSGPYPGNDVAIAFNYNFRVDSENQLKVFETDDNGTTTELTLTTDYTVSGVGNDAGGQVTRVAGALPTGYTWYIRSNYIPTQPTDFESQGGFFPDIHEAALDKLTFLLQQIEELVDRGIRFDESVSDIGVLTISGDAATRANQVVAFDATGSDIELQPGVGRFRGDWATPVNYAVRDIIIDAAGAVGLNNVYICNTPHLSTDLAADIANWDLMIDLTDVVASEDAAAASAAAALVSENNAATSASNASTSETNASTSASNASTSETNAAVSAAAALVSETNAANSFDEFDDIYLGSKAVDPTLDNDGDTLQDGALYFNTTANELRVYDLGNTTWIAINVTAVDYFAGQISGLVPSNAADADHDITISVGKCRDSANTKTLELTSPITKQIDAAWVAGDAAGGMFSGSVAADTTYHLFIIEKDSDGTIDAGFDTSVTAANIPAGYTAYRRIASFITDASSNLIAFNAVEADGGGYFLEYMVRIIDLATASPSTTGVSLTLSVPADVQFFAQVACRLVNGSVAIVTIGQDVSGVAPSGNNSDLVVQIDAIDCSIVKQITTNTNSQIEYRSSNGSVSAFNLMTIGYTDFRRD